MGSLHIFAYFHIFYAYLCIFKFAYYGIFIDHLVKIEVTLFSDFSVECVGLGLSKRSKRSKYYVPAGT